MAEDIKYDIKKGSIIYRMIYGSRFRNWILQGKIKKGETEVWRSGLSGWRKPETLPELEAYFNEYEKEKQKKEKPVPFLTLPKKIKIESLLIIDDEKELCDLLCEGLIREKFKVEGSYSGEEGLEYVKEYKPDLVILDIKLPDIDGMEVLSRIKEIDPRIPILIISAYGTEELKEEARVKGAVNFLDKPVDVEKILQEIKNTEEKS